LLKLLFSKTSDQMRGVMKAGLGWMKLDLDPCSSRQMAFHMRLFSGFAFVS
jgi:hypothetical protein